MSATAKVKDEKLVIEIPLQTPQPSKSGKTLIVATTSGFTPTTAEVNKKPVMVSVNAFIKK